MKKPYEPINCHFYDELELLAVRAQPCSILYRTEEDKTASTVDVITDFKIIEKAEFMLLKSGRKIRLDQLISVNNKELKGYC